VAFKIIIPNSVKKDLNHLTESVFERIIMALRELEENPRPASCKKLKDRDAWRIRVGDYRIIYEIDDEKAEVVLVRVRHRREAYR
jgi:mRNA interferase RelE/StbE